MIAVGLAWFIVRRSDDTIYRSQLRTRADAPAQRLLLGMPVLAKVPVRQSMASPRLVITGETSVEAAHRQLAHVGLNGAPIVDSNGRFEGTISLARLEASDVGREHRLESIMDVTAPTVSESAHLDVAVDAITTSSEHWVPVLDSERKVVGTVATSDVVRGYRLGLLASLQKMNADGGAAGSERVRIGARSPLVGIPLSKAGLPVSIIVTTIQRKRDLVVPSGSTKLEAGDELVLIGTSSDIDDIRAIASGIDGVRDDSAHPDTKNTAQKEPTTQEMRP
jgi:chloride channel protein, CIC family